MTPIVNKIYKVGKTCYRGLKWTRKRFIVDIPPMPPEMQARIKQEVLDFASKTISDSIVKAAENAVQRSR